MAKQHRKLIMTAATVENCKNTGDTAEQLAAKALTKAGFSNVVNLNVEIRRNFPFADLLAERDGISYAVSVKGRTRITSDGKVNTGYKVKRSDAVLAVREIRRVKNVECLPAFAAVEFDGDKHSIYFDLLERSTRKNRIGMKESERASYECLVHKELHNLTIHPIEYRTEQQAWADSILQKTVDLCKAFRANPKGDYGDVVAQLDRETFDTLLAIGVESDRFESVCIRSLPNMN
jgi:Holliday junction resolvase-like predicted endonuclease